MALGIFVYLLFIKSYNYVLQERDAKDIEIPNIRWDVFEFMMRCEFGFYSFYLTCYILLVP